MAIPWQNARPLAPAVFEEVRLRTIFDCMKWDPQVQDVSILADVPLILTRQAWQTIAGLAEKLADETLAAEQALICNPALHAQLGLPPAITQLWKRPPDITKSVSGDARIIRFDFHWTTEGWRISEANSDVPGGFNEASGFTRLMAEYYGDTVAAGDPATTLAQAVQQSVEPGALIAMVHATAYTDDRQVMLYLAQHLEREGLRTVLVSPANLRWDDNGAALATDWQQGTVDFLVRFFPAEWLPNLRRSANWQRFFTGRQLPACNPTTALLTQSKRFPLVWDKLQTALPTWKALLPETRDPRTLDRTARDSEEWVYKPALGRVGEDIGIRGVTGAKDWQRIRKQALRHAAYWVAQKRFEPLPLIVGDQRWYPCIGVYTVDGRAAGAYGRMASIPLISSVAKDVAILVNREGS